MKKLIFLIIIAIGASCAPAKELPFATTNRQGKYPVKKNKPYKNNSTWVFKQWAHEGR